MPQPSMAQILATGRAHGRPPREERSNEAPDVSPLEACMQLSLFGATFLKLDKDGAKLADAEDEQRRRPRTRSPWSAEESGFNLHAGVTVRAGAREALERLCRYGARPCFSLDRLSVLAGGRVVYRLRKPRRNGATHLVLEPLHFLARISSIIPPPRYPLLRLSGVFAPSSPWRKSVVPRGPVARATALAPTPPPKRKSRESSAAATRILAGPEPPRPSQDAPPPPPSGPRTSLGSGVVKPAGGRIDWASLLRRIYLEDVLACPCGGRRRLIADIGQRAQRDGIVAILAHLGLPTEAPPIARARSPSFDAA
jgi:hypothetical protein